MHYLCMGGDRGCTPRFRGCTSKPVNDYGKIGDEPRVAAYMRAYSRDTAHAYLFDMIHHQNMYLLGSMEVNLIVIDTIPTCVFVMLYERFNLMCYPC